MALQALAATAAKQLRVSTHLGVLISNPSCAGTLVPQRQYAAAATDLADSIKWVFLGPPGVGKGTYASRAAKHFNVAHIATGDLIRAEMKRGSTLGKQLSDIVNQGKLVPDDLIFKLLSHRVEQGAEAGEKGFILDGFPRTRVQAVQLLELSKVQVAFNMSLREEVLVEKCLGRRLCRHCGKSYNVANIYLPATDGKPEIVMPPLTPPPECAPHLEIRADDTEQVIRHRLEVYRSQAAPVEQYFREAGLLHNFEITAGIPETLPGLLQALQQFVPHKQH
mmetsp:Transcript_31165/g.69296  ORF Transcript_31165/g.69296 Transcript_31165/m.69296 type:complete len:279 (+) Transcript_31165:49-885(+)